MYQHLVVVGNVGRDPEMRFTPSGKAVTSFSVATNRQWTNDKGEAVKETTWFRCVTWGKQAEVCNQYLKKGSKVLVDGHLICDEVTGGPKLWTDKDGASHASFEIQSGTVRFLSSKGDDHPDEHAPAVKTDDPDSKGIPVLADDQIPF